MKVVSCFLLLPLICFMIHSEAKADATFTGVFLSGRGQGLVAGNILIKVSGSHASFEARLFQQFVTNATLELVLETKGQKIPLALGVGTQGAWPTEDFLSPVPGGASAPSGRPGQLTNLESMPTLSPPAKAFGTRFTGSITNFPELEQHVLTHGGTARLQMHRALAGPQDSAFTATLVNIKTTKHPPH